MPNVFNPQPEPERIEESAPVSTLPIAWQPFTFRGVAAFAFASYTRFFWIQTFFAALSAGAIVWALWYAWTPVIRSAVRSLPNETPVRNGQLVHAPSAAPLLAESRHLAILLRPESTTAAGDVRIQFETQGVRVCSLFGCRFTPYVKNQTIYITRAEAIPWWDAWEPILLGIVGLISGLFFLALWSALATVVFLFVRLYAYFADRQLTLSGAWQLSAAAFLPGSLGFVAALVLYALGFADLIRLLLAVPGHLLIALVYLGFAPRKLDRIPSVPPPFVNPFTATTAPGKTSTEQSPPGQ